MRGYAAGITAALLIMLLLVSGAKAQESLRLYVSRGMLGEVEVQRLLTRMNGEVDQWALMQDDRPLRELVLAGDMPDLAICAPAQALPWAKEGLLLALQTHMGDQQRLQRQILRQCVYGEELFMAPLIAHHRQMAINVGRMDEIGLGYMLDSQTYPVWYPAQFYQILEEFLLHDTVALDVWRADLEDSAPLEALTQAIYGGMLLSEEGVKYQADSPAMCAGVQWLADAVDDEMIGYCATREEALARFLSGETAIFIDWNKDLEKQMNQEGMQLEIRVHPYPSAFGLPVRSFDLAGICAFASGDAARDARLAQACARVYESAQDVLGPQGIWQDGAVWLPDLDTAEGGTTLRSLFCAALQDVMEERMPAELTLMRVQAAMDALEQTK